LIQRDLRPWLRLLGANGRSDLPHGQIWDELKIAGIVCNQLGAIVQGGGSYEQVRQRQSHAAVGLRSNYLASQLGDFPTSADRR
jgi:hypothetical protein